MTLKSKLAAIAVIIIGGGSLIYLVLSYDDRANVAATTVSSSSSGQADEILRYAVVDTTVEGDKSESVEATTVSPSSTLPPTLSSRLLFMGDVFWGRSVNKWSQDSELKYDFPFSGLATLEREKYDAWIANLECPITTRIMTPAEQERGLRFTCLPEYLPSAHKFFDVFSLANNHTDNQEQIGGLKSSREYLEKEGIQYFGSFDNRVLGDVCEVVTVAATSASPSEGALIPIALCGYNNVFSLPSKASLDVITTYSKHFPTIILPHQGQEYVNKPDRYKIATYRTMIDNGADLVVGAHPHAVQSTEVYKGKLIAYSLGNFIFDQQSTKTVTNHAALDVTIDFKNPESENMVKWLALAKDCQKYKDDCLTQAQNQNLSKPEFNLKYDLVATENEKKVTQKANEKIQAEILKLANWEKTLLELGQK